MLSVVNGGLPSRHQVGVIQRLNNLLDRNHNSYASINFACALTVVIHDSVLWIFDNKVSLNHSKHIIGPMALNDSRLQLCACLNNTVRRHLNKYRRAAEAANGLC